MSRDGYERLSVFYLAYLLIDTLRYFNILLILDVNITNSDVNNINKGSLFLSSNNFTFYISLMTAETCRVYEK